LLCDFRGIAVVIHRAHVNDFPLRIQDEELRRAGRSVVLCDLLRFIEKIREGSTA
jgi:hypothetical protein